MRRSALTAVAAVLLAGPTVIAFASGGYFTGARLVALAIAWVALAVAVLAAGDEDRRAVVRDRAFVAAVGGLALLAAWTAASAWWAPLEAPAVDARERALLYLAVLAAAALALRPRAVLRWAEPALAGGIAIVVAYGVLGRLGLFDVESTLSAGGRLDQPLTYWNAQGALAALGLVLAARLAGSVERPVPVRLVAAGAAPLLGLGVYLTFSRGALAALAVGLALLLALAPGWAQLRAAAIAVEASAVAVAAAEALPDAVALVVLAGVMLAAAGVQAWSAQAEADGTTRTGTLPRLALVRRAAVGAAVVLALVPFAAALVDRGSALESPAFGATAERLSSAGSNRYAYWQVAVDAFADDPALGIGAGGFEAAWRERRDIDERVRDAHSLPLETAAELGIVGLLLLAVFAGGVVSAARRSWRLEPELAAGPVAALGVWAAHAAIDWDWEMPALTLVAAVLAGLLIASAAQRRTRVSSRPITAATTT